MRLHAFLNLALALALGVAGSGCASTNNAQNPYGQANAQPSTWSKFTTAVSKPFKRDTQVAESSKVEASDPTSVFAKPPKQLDANFFVAVAAQQERNNPKAAEASYQKALQLEPKNVNALLSYARLHDRQKNFAEAIKLYEQAVALQPKNSAACNDLGLCLARQGQLDKAVARLEQAVRLQPDKKLYRNNLATVLVEIGRPHDAFAHLAAAHPADVAHYNVGYLLAQSNQPSAAVPHFQAALKANPNLAEARQWLDSLNQAQNIAEAPAEPIPAVAAERVASQPDERQRHALVPARPASTQLRPLLPGERYGERQGPKLQGPSQEQSELEQPAVDYEALPSTSALPRSSDGEASDAGIDTRDVAWPRSYEARNSGWSNEPPDRR